MQLQIAVLAKQMQHHSAATSPTLRQLRASEVLGGVVGALSMPDSTWSSWCHEQAAHPGRPGLGALQTQRRSLKRRISEHVRESADVGAPMLKRPAAAVFWRTQKRPAGVAKRTVFTRARRESLKRGSPSVL